MCVRLLRGGVTERMQRSLVSTLVWLTPSVRVCVEMCMFVGGGRLQAPVAAPRSSRLFRLYSTETVAAPKPHPTGSAPVSEKVTALADQIAGLTLVEASQLATALKVLTRPLVSS